MTTNSDTSPPSFQSQNVLRQALVILLGAGAIALGAQISTPMVPVPTTLQTLALVFLGLCFGPFLAMGAASAYLVMVLIGLPVLSSGQQVPGWEFTQFLAAGYVVGFIPGAGLAGWLGRQGGFLRRTLAGLAGHSIILLLGAVVMAYWLDPSTALERGVLPFLFGALAKSLAAAALMSGIDR